MTVQAQTQEQVQSTANPDKSRLLRNVLKANVEFSIISGLLFIFASGSVAEFLGIAETPILGLMKGKSFIFVMGLVILEFAGLVLFTVTRKEINRLWATEIMIADAAWVVISVALILTDALNLTTEGSWAVLIVADIVLGFALMEYWGLRRMKKGD